MIDLGGIVVFDCSPTASPCALRCLYYKIFIFFYLLLLLRAPLEFLSQDRQPQPRDSRPWWSRRYRSDSDCRCSSQTLSKMPTDIWTTWTAISRTTRSAAVKAWNKNLSIHRPSQGCSYGRKEKETTLKSLATQNRGWEQRKLLSDFFCINHNATASCFVSCPLVSCMTLLERYCPVLCIIYLLKILVNSLIISGLAAKRQW